MFEVFGQTERPIIGAAIFGNLRASSVELEIKPEQMTFPQKGDSSHRQKKTHLS